MTYNDLNDIVPSTREQIEAKAGRELTNKENRETKYAIARVKLARIVSNLMQ